MLGAGVRATLALIGDAAVVLRSGVWTVAAGVNVWKIGSETASGCCVGSGPGSEKVVVDGSDGDVGSWRHKSDCLLPCGFVGKHLLIGLLIRIPAWSPARSLLPPRAKEIGTPIVERLAIPACAKDVQVGGRRAAAYQRHPK